MIDTTQFKERMQPDARTFLCEGCGKTGKNLTRYQGVFLCKECLAEVTASLRCDWCESQCKKLYSFGDNWVCPSCYQVAEAE